MIYFLVLCGAIISFYIVSKREKLGSDTPEAKQYSNNVRKGCLWFLIGVVAVILIAVIYESVYVHNKKARMQKMETSRAENTRNK